MLSTYRKFITFSVIPEIKRLLAKYSVWWRFKPNSLLKEYLKKNNLYLTTYFNPKDLYDSIIAIAKSKNLFDRGNKKVIVLNNKLQDCFDEWFIYTLDIFKHCLHHVDIVNKDESVKLQNRAIHNNMRLKLPNNIIYNDPSSLFTLHPQINYYLNKNDKLVYSWKELYDLILDFCTTNTDHFTRCNETILAVNSNSELSTILEFKYFDISQIEDILKKITKYLGKTHNLENYCPKLIFDFSKIDKNIFALIDFSSYNMMDMWNKKGCHVSL